MNKFLLDTHIFLWGILEPDRLSERVAAELQSPNSELWLSPISTWEIAILAEKGRIEIDDTPRNWLQDTRRLFPFREAPLTHEIALRSREIVLPHQDPADRFLVATAIIYDLTLVTADSRLIDATISGLSVLPC